MYYVFHLNVNVGLVCFIVKGAQYCCISESIAFIKIDWLCLVRTIKNSITNFCNSLAVSKCHWQQQLWYQQYIHLFSNLAAGEERVYETLHWNIVKHVHYSKIFHFIVYWNRNHSYNVDKNPWHMTIKRNKRRKKWFHSINKIVIWFTTRRRVKDGTEQVLKSSGTIVLRPDIRIDWFTTMSFHQVTKLASMRFRDTLGCCFLSLV